jgi:hypothetical protein
VLFTPPDGLITDRLALGATVHAGVLADWYLTGAVAERDGRVVLQRLPAQPDALEQRLFGRIGGPGPVTWQQLIGDDVKAGAEVARDLLLYEGLVRAVPVRRLGVLRYMTYPVTDTASAAEIRASVVEILRRAKAAEPDIATVVRAAMAVQPPDIGSLRGRQRRELLAELRRRAEADLLAAHQQMGGRGIDDQDAAFVALAVCIPYRNRQFKIPGEYSEQYTALAERIAPVASGLSRVLGTQRWQRALV